MPPPPAAALSAIGQPYCSPSSITRAGSSTRSVVPGTIGTPAASMISRARIFEPIASIASGGGPIQAMPSAAQRRANDAFSARKP